jgi:Carbohydrate esterase, sialic acid-specific acetylesterase
VATLCCILPFVTAPQTAIRKARVKLQLALGLIAAISLIPARAQDKADTTASRVEPNTPTLTLSSPLEYQVFQRSTRLHGAIIVRATAPAATRVEARVEGTSLAGPLPGKWHRLAFDQQDHQFSGQLPVIAGGFYRVEIKATNTVGRPALLAIQHVGVGEVFVIAGQSNSTNYGEVPQTTQTGMVTSFSGTAWVLANDPQPGVQDNSHKGSFAPSFGDALYRRYHVPIGIASAGHGSTSVRQWLPVDTPIQVMPTMTRYVRTNSAGILVSDGTLFEGMMQRIHQLGVHGFRALLWHQGESDSHQPPEHNIDAATYRDMMVTIIRASRKQAGWDFPWFVAQATYHTPEDPGCSPIRDAQRSLWQPDLALEGPDTDTLTAPYRQNGGEGTHFNDAGLKAHGLLWADKVSQYLDTMLH